MYATFFSSARASSLAVRGSPGTGQLALCWPLMRPSQHFDDALAVEPRNLLTPFAIARWHLLSAESLPNWAALSEPDATLNVWRTAWSSRQARHVTMLLQFVIAPLQLLAWSVGHEPTPPHPYDDSARSSPLPHVPSFPPHFDATEFAKRERAAVVMAVTVPFASQSVDAGSVPFMRASWQRWIALARNRTYFAEALVIARAHGESAAYADETSATTTTGTTKSRFILLRYGTFACG